MSIRHRLFVLLLLFSPTFVFSGNDISTSNSKSLELQEAPTPLQNIHVIVNTPDNGTPTEVHFHNINKPIQKNQNINKPKVITSTNTTVTVISKAFSSVQSRISNFLQQHNIQLTKLSPSELAQSAQTFIKLNKKRIAFGAFIGTYICVSAALLADNHYLNRSDLWAAWKKHMSAGELQECPQHELQQSLRETILNRYLTHSKDRLSSYMEFMKAVDRENRRISRYIWLAQIVKRSRLMRIFPTNDTKIKRAKRKKKRLAFVKHVFISWAAQQNFEKV